MRDIIPLRGSVLCRKVEGGTSTEIVKGIRKNVQKVDIYRISELPVEPLGDEYGFKVGDLVVSNSTGDEIEVNPGDVVYLFKVENLMCVVEDGEKA